MNKMARNFESAFVYKKRASFGKSQLLNGSTLANQNKNKMLRMMKSNFVFQLNLALFEALWSLCVVLNQFSMQLAI